MSVSYRTFGRISWTRERSNVLPPAPQVTIELINVLRALQIQRLINTLNLFGSPYLWYSVPINRLDTKGLCLFYGTTSSAQIIRSEFLFDAGDPCSEDQPIRGGENVKAIARYRGDIGDNKLQFAKRGLFYRVD